MDSNEQWQLSESDEDLESVFDPYESDPKFETVEELQEFLAGCDLSKAREVDGEMIDYELHQSVEKICTCGKCADIWSDGFQHVCCHQTDRSGFEQFRVNIRIKTR